MWLKFTIEELTTYAQSPHLDKRAYEMKVLSGIDVSHDGEFQIKLDLLGKGDYTIVVEFFSNSSSWGDLNHTD